MKNHFYVTAFLLFVFLVPPALHSQEIVGPDHVASGSLATFGIQGGSGGASWCLVPDDQS